jgi:hypothetical protein
MNLPFHLFRLNSNLARNELDTVPIAKTADVNWNRPIFRAPSLPTHHQVSSETPFFVNFRAKDRIERKSA